ncbi:MAG TPA: SPFH domain-containing protein [Ktedonobacteraceae bacterium]
MTSEQDDSPSTWQSNDAEDDDNDWRAPPGYGAQNMQSQTADDQDESDSDEEPDVKGSSFFGFESLRNFGRQFSPVLVPLPFALLIFLFTYVASMRQTPHLQTLPLIILLLALSIMQGTMLYYAGSNEDLWLLCMIFGYSLFLIVGTFTVFGGSGAIILFVALLVLMVFFAQRGFRPVPEGYVDIVFSFGRYTRTLSPGPKLVWPWEKVIQRMNIKERLWTCPLQVVKISRDQDVRLIATISYQLLPEDAFLAFSVEKWEESLRILFVGTLQALINQLTPADFIPSPQAHGSSLRTTGPNGPIDPAQETRWERINNALASRVQDRIAAWGVQVNWVRIQDVTLIPHLTPAASPPPGMQVQTRQSTAAGNYAAGPGNSATKKAVPAGTATPAVPVGAAVETAPLPSSDDPDQTVVMEKNTVKDEMVKPQPQQMPDPDAVTSVSSQAIKPDVLRDIYEAVRQGRITDPNTIRDAAQRFEAVAKDPELSQTVDFDAGRAAATLYQRAKMIEELSRAHASPNAKR